MSCHLPQDSGTRLLHPQSCQHCMLSTNTSLNHKILPNLLVLMMKYSGITRSMPWLLMSWLLASPSHLQPLLLNTCMQDQWVLAFFEVGIQLPIKLRNERKCKYIFIVSSSKSVRNGYHQQTGHYRTAISAISIIISRLTHCGLVMPYGKDFGQHWFR